MEELKGYKFISLDTETTGLSRDTDRILELALREFDPITGHPHKDNFKHWLIDPQRDIPKQASEVHGITAEMLKGKPIFKDISNEFLEFCKESVIVIHNAKFDVGMLNAELARIGYSTFESVPKKVIDTLALSRKLKHKVNTLDALCDVYNVDRSIRVTHGALTDCDLLAQVYPHLINHQTKVASPISELLGFDILKELEDDCSVDMLIAQSIQIEKLSTILNSLKKERVTILKEKLGDVDYCGSTGKVTFSPRVTTNWTKVTEDYLAGVDLGKYQKNSSAMYVKDLSDSDEGETND